MQGNSHLTRNYYVHRLMIANPRDKRGKKQCNELNSEPLKIQVHLKPHNVTLLGNGSYWVRWALIHRHRPYEKRRHTETHREHRLPM